MNVADELKKLQDLHQSGALTDEEFAKAKAAIIEQKLPPPAAVSSSPSPTGGATYSGPRFPWGRAIGILIAVLVVWYGYRVYVNISNALAISKVLNKVEMVEAHLLATDIGGAISGRSPSTISKKAEWFEKIEYSDCPSEFQQAWSKYTKALKAFGTHVETASKVDGKRPPKGKDAVEDWIEVYPEQGRTVKDAWADVEKVMNRIVEKSIFNPF